MSKTIKEVVDDYGLENWRDKEEFLKEIETIMLERVIGRDIDIADEMEKVGARDFQRLDAIARTGGLLNKHKSDQRQADIAKISSHFRLDEEMVAKVVVEVRE